MTLSAPTPAAIRVLVVDSEPAMGGAYREALVPASRFAPEFAHDAREAAPEPGRK